MFCIDRPGFLYFLVHGPFLWFCLGVVAACLIFTAVVLRVRREVSHDAR